MLDSNILIKLVINEPGSEKAEKYIKEALRKGCSIYTVDIALAECLNTLWKHAKLHKDLKEEEAKSAAQDLIEIYDKLNIFTTREVFDEATSLALTWNITVYDSIYIAAAKKIKAILYTADQKLYNTLKNIVTFELLSL
ncbi:MAG: type II toxin-antitoxin system VapC family toxin [Candidatus Bathyarchaeia archaeon]|nr:type II toxin-antitoxin system VapC family toxin [Candidatus Bathyarchaeota archaeon]